MSDRSGEDRGKRPPGPISVARLRPVLLEIRDRAAASDPGFVRLRAAVAVALGVGTTLIVEQLTASAVGITGPTVAAMALFGAVVAMIGSNGLSGMGRTDRLRAVVGFPLAACLGLVLAASTDRVRWLQVIAFSVVLFGAVWVRRFGGSWFYYGFLTWMGFFFATFLNASWALVPELALAAVVASAWVVLLGLTVLATSPRQVLHSTLSAFFARGRAVAREAADLLALPPGSRRRRERALGSLAARRAGMAEAGLLADAWSVEPAAVPTGWSAPALRRRLIEAQQAMERVGASAVRMVDAEASLRGLATTAADQLARRDDVAALRTCDRLERAADEVEAAGGDGWWSARRLAHGVREFVRFDAAADQPPEVDPGEDEFESATALTFGALPGSPSVAGDVVPRGRRNPMARFSLTTRQAAQVALAGALALGLGTLLSPTRYYWAVIAAFVMFTGTGTRYETLNKGVARVVGTIGGLAVAVVLAHLTVGHTPLVLVIILVSVFAAFYLAKVSQAAMTFFITVLLGEMYTVLGTFSDAVLVLRLGETAIGAVAGVAVALLFTPLSTRDTVRSARDEMLAAMVDLLERVAVRAEQPDAVPSVVLDAAVRRLDDRARRLALVTRPLIGPVALGQGNPRTRRRLTLYVAAVSQCRALTLDVQQRRVRDADAVAAACRAIADAARALAARPPGAAVPLAEEPLSRAASVLFGRGDTGADGFTSANRAVGAVGGDLAGRHLHHLGATLSEVTRTPSPGHTPSHRA